MSRRNKTGPAHGYEDLASRQIELEMIRRDSASLPNDFHAFVVAAWSEVEQFEFKDSWHIRAVCDHLQAAAERRITKLCVNVPPRTGKSTLISVLFPAWVLARSPREEILTASYSSILATRDAVKTRMLIESDWYASRFPHVQIREDSNLKQSLKLTAGGGRHSLGVSGTLTGLGGTIRIVDDPLNASDAESATVRETTNVWLKESWSTRTAGDPEKAVSIVVMQRLHAQDPTQYCIENGFVMLVLPMEYEGATETNALGWADPRTEFGELLWPAQYNASVVAGLKASLGSYGYSSQFQMRPTPRGGGTIKKQWLRFYTDPSKSTPPPVMAQLESGEFVELPQVPKDVSHLPITASFDCAFKGTAKSDFVVGQAWAREGANYILVDQVRGRMDFVATCQAVRALHQKYHCNPTLIEAAANGHAVVQALRNEIDGIIDVTPEGGKESRTAAVSPLFEAGNVFLPHPAQAPWVQELIDELILFPKGPNDDQVDALTQAITFMRVRKTYAVDLGAALGGRIEAASDSDFVGESYWAN